MHTLLNTIQACRFDVYLVFVLSCPFPLCICRTIFLLGKTGIVNHVLSPPVLCETHHPSSCPFTAYSPAPEIAGKNSLYPFFVALSDLLLFSNTVGVVLLPRKEKKKKRLFFLYHHYCKNCQEVLCGL